MKTCIIPDEYIQCEADNELKKDLNKLAFDIVKEANSIYPNEDAASIKVNLDIVKHLVKRLDLHVLNIEKKAKSTNILLIILSVIMAIGSVATIIQLFLK